MSLPETDPVPTGQVVDEETKETLRELVQMCNSLQTTVDDLKDEVEAKDEQIADLQEQLNDQQTKAQVHESRLDGLNGETDRLSLGMTELQVRALKQGATLSRDAVDKEFVQGDMDLPLEDMYDGAAVKAEEVDSGGAAGSLEFLNDASLVEIEKDRQKIKRGLIEPNDLGKQWKLQYRAIHVWDLFEAACDEENENWVLGSKKVRRQLREFCGDEVSDGSLSMIASRVMKTVAEKSDGVLDVRKGRDGKNQLVGAAAAVQDAKQPLHRTVETVQGNTVVKPE